MKSTENGMSVADAARCFYIAQLLEQKGEMEAAQRWRQQGNRWIQEEPTNGNNEQFTVEL